MALIVYLVLFVYLTQNVVKLVLQSDPTITTMTKMVNLREQKHIKISDYSFEILPVIVGADNTTGLPYTVKVPPSIGTWSLSHFESESFISRSSRQIPRIKCTPQYTDFLKSIDMESNSFGGMVAETENCFDFQHGNAIIGGKWGFGKFSSLYL